MLLIYCREKRIYDFIFGVDEKMRICTGMYYLTVGGKAGSPIEKYCKETGYDGINFEVVEDDTLDKWLKPPYENQQDDGLPF